METIYPVHQMDSLVASVVRRNLVWILQYVVQLTIRQSLSILEENQSPITKEKLYLISTEETKALRKLWLFFDNE
jgi:hypothetical protein